MKRLIAGVVLAGILYAGCFVQAFAQTACPAAPADPIARDALRLKWNAVTLDVDSKPLPAGSVVTYTVYELVGTAWAARCTTTAVNAGQLGLSVGDHTYAVTAKVPALIESARSNQFTKAIPPQTVAAPGSFTIEGTIVVTGTITISPQ